MNCNVNQCALLQWITAGLAIPEVRGLHGDAGYLLNNMIAKFSLAADTYLISDGALAELKKMNVDLNKEHSRSFLYGKPKPFIYEHAIPVCIVRSLLLDSDPQKENISHTLKMAGEVALILRTEDNLLHKRGLSRKMPNDWSWGQNPLARYNAAGIIISDHRLKVKGAICR